MTPTLAEGAAKLDVDNECVGVGTGGSGWGDKIGGCKVMFGVLEGGVPWGCILEEEILNADGNDLEPEEDREARWIESGGAESSEATLEGLPMLPLERSLL